MRNASAPVFEFQAHEKACSSLSFSPHMPNMMATCSVDEYVKIWDIAHNGGTEPKLISYKKLSMVNKLSSYFIMQGELFSVSFYKDIPWVLAAGGSKGEVAVWDTEENEILAAHFGSTLDKSCIPEEDADIEDVASEESSEEELKKEEKKQDKKEAKKEVKKDKMK